MLGIVHLFVLFSGWGNLLCALYTIRVCGWFSFLCGVTQFLCGVHDSYVLVGGTQFLCELYTIPFHSDTRIQAIGYRDTGHSTQIQGYRPLDTGTQAIPLRYKDTGHSTWNLPSFVNVNV